MATETLLATTGQIFLRLLELHGIDAERFVREGGYDPALFRDPAARLPTRAVDQASRAAAERIADPAFALRAARCWHPSNLGALGHAWLASSTLRTALRRLERFNRILTDKATFRLEESARGLRLVFDHRRADIALAAPGVDFAFSILIDMCRMNYGAALRPLEVTLGRAKPADAGPWEHFFGCRVQFGAARHSFLLSRRDADEPLPVANRQLAAALDAILTRQLAHLDRSNVAARCKAVVLERLASGESPEGEVARVLHMSRRTLQRKLAEEDLTYQQLVDDTRRDLALRYLEDPGKSLTEITFLLGFSGQSAFTRAFRRWTGKSPSAYRPIARTLAS
ncbi:MAG: AraC family transcriptional regulator [Burkholderiales bacterium]|nr:AraC family transcriptional regulator [Burkholderiales bacterium]